MFQSDKELFQSGDIWKFFDNKGVKKGFGAQQVLAIMTGKVKVIQTTSFTKNVVVVLKDDNENLFFNRRKAEVIGILTIYISSKIWIHTTRLKSQLKLEKMKKIDET